MGRDYVAIPQGNKADSSVLSPGTVIAIGVRHGRTKDNSPSHPKLRAWANPPLNRLGELDAHIAASKIAAFRPKIIYSSDLDRDVQTANIISKALSIPHEVDFGFRTADMGEWTEMAEDKVADQVMGWYRNPWQEAPSGESYNTFTKRLFGTLDPLLNLAIESEAYRPIAFATHGRDLAALDARYNLLLPEKAKMPFPGGVLIIRHGIEPNLEFLTETEPVQKDV